MAATDIPTLILSRAQVALGRDAGGIRTLVVTDGTTEIVLVGSDDRRADLDGSARIMDGLWDYRRTLAGEHHAAERMEALAARYGVDGPTTSEASVKDLPAGQ